MKALCHSLLSAVQHTLLKRASEPEANVFYLKSALCFDVCCVVRRQLTLSASCVVCDRMMGDHYRYLAEIELTHSTSTTTTSASASATSPSAPTSTSTTASTTASSQPTPQASGLKSMECYESAAKAAAKALVPVHPLRLGLALNQSVLLFPSSAFVPCVVCCVPRLCLTTHCLHAFVLALGIGVLL